jgi:hypothetical protein
MSSFFFEGLHIIEKLETIVDIFEGLRKALLFSVSYVRQGLPHNPESGLKHIYQIDINVD